MGLSARYVSGYLDTKSFRDKPAEITRDHSHAWWAIHIPDWGWFDLDPTLGHAADDRYIVTAWGSDYTDVAPITGRNNGGGSQNLSVSVDVARI